MKPDLLKIGLLSPLLSVALGLTVAQAALPLAGSRSAAPARADIIHVGERLDRKPLPQGAQPVKRSPETATNAIVTDLAATYEKATGSPDHVLTKQAAIDSGWGWAVDHFDDIDKQKKGAVSLDDVLDYVSQTARIALPRGRRSTQAIQVVH